MEGIVATMDFSTDQQAEESKRPADLGTTPPSDEASLAPGAASPSGAAPTCDPISGSHPGLRVVSETESPSLGSGSDDESFGTGPNRVAPAEYDAENFGNDVADQPAGVAEEPVEIHPHRVVEAVLFAADSPMPPTKIAAVLGVGDARDVRKHIEQLNAEYASHGLAFRIEQLAGGYQMLTLPAYNSWLRKLLRARQETRLSPAALETLAIVAYKQPCTRAEVEAIRGVAAGDLINRLREMNLVKIVGRAEDLGRPLLYGTTKRFLEVFGLPSLDELPQVEALSGGGNGAVRETAKMPAAALANGAVEEQRSAEKLRDAQQIPDALPDKTLSIDDQSPTAAAAVARDTAPPDDQVSE